jgi:hypothetical protein
MAKKDKKGRVVRVSKETNRIFKQILLDLEDRGIERTPNQLADELFEIGVFSKESELKRDQINGISQPN